jgi:zinc transporter 1
MSDSRYIRLGIMIFLTGSFFVAELVVGNVSRSLALVADSFHMLSDVLSMIVGVVAIKVRLFPSSLTLQWLYD